MVMACPSWDLKEWDPTESTGEKEEEEQNEVIIVPGPSGPPVHPEG